MSGRAAREMNNPDPHEGCLIGIVLIFYMI